MAILKLQIKNSFIQEIYQKLFLEMTEDCFTSLEQAYPQQRE